jgi:hypothetical protein
MIKKGETRRCYSSNSRRRKCRPDNYGKIRQNGLERFLLEVPLKGWLERLKSQ